MEVKGTVLQTMKLYIPKAHTKSDYEMWIDELSPEVKLIFKMGPSPGSWYSFKDYLIEPTKKYCDLFHDGDLKGARELGRFGAEHSLNGIYTLFVKLNAVDFIINRAAKILPMYYRPSSVEVGELREGFCSMRITEFSEINEMVEHRIAGWMEKALELHGCKNIRFEITESLTNGGKYTELQFTWT